MNEFLRDNITRRLKALKTKESKKNKREKKVRFLAMGVVVVMGLTILPGIFSCIQENSKQDKLHKNLTKLQNVVESKNRQNRNR